MGGIRRIPPPQTFSPIMTKTKSICMKLSGLKDKWCRVMLTPQQGCSHCSTSWFKTHKWNLFLQIPRFLLFFCWRFQHISKISSKIVNKQLKPVEKVTKTHLLAFLCAPRSKNWKFGGQNFQIIDIWKTQNSEKYREVIFVFWFDFEVEKKSSTAQN